MAVHPLLRRNFIGKAVPKGSYWTFGTAFSLKNSFFLEFDKMSRVNAETYEDIVRWMIK